MTTFQRRWRRILSTSSALVGLFLLYWSISAVFSASHTPNTVPIVDEFLGSIDWIWLTGLGGLLVLLSGRRLLLSLSRRTRIAAVAYSVVGGCLVALWGVFVALSLSSLGGMLFFSPLLVIGGLLLALGIVGWRMGDE